MEVVRSGACITKEHNASLRNVVPVFANYCICELVRILVYPQKIGALDLFKRLIWGSFLFISPNILKWLYLQTPPWSHHPDQAWFSMLPQGLPESQR
ncbi:MAG: hypothetical protein FWC66_05110 [Oscillospiraceae bacterium]|nr:hypothetical protein [Oscillospiraceae bacterium]